MLIKDLRKLKGLTREEFAAKVGASFGSVAGWESTGKTTEDKSIGRAFRVNMERMAKRGQR